MTKYKIGVFKNDEGRIINLDKIVKLKELERIDEFTKSFNSEEEFKLYLCKQEIIMKEELNYKIKVVYNKDGKAKKIPIIYKPMEKYMDRINLKNRLLNLSEPYNYNDKEEIDQSIVFLEKLVNHYYVDTRINLNDIRFYINTIKCGGDILYNINILKPALEELYKKVVYKKANRNVVKVDYKSFRDLAIFVYKQENKIKEYKEKLEQEKENDSFNQLDIFGYQKRLQEKQEEIVQKENGINYRR